MTKLSAALGSVLLLSLPQIGLGADPPPPAIQSSESGFYASAELPWKDAASLPLGAKIAVLEGDPSKDGPFLMRIRLPDGFHIPPHTHPKTERVTILSGTFHVAMGEQLERSAARALPTGSYGFWPAGMKHAAWAQGETIVQVHGIGPWAINYVNPADDPRIKKQ
ncbi:MAG: cupin domain-containing protein [Steroidobacteraceae bacterium]